MTTPSTEQLDAWGVVCSSLKEAFALEPNGVVIYVTKQADTPTPSERDRPVFEITDAAISAAALVVHQRCSDGHGDAWARRVAEEVLQAAAQQSV